MAYDPKKKRPSTKSLDSVVDEIFGEEPLDSKATKGVKAKASPKASASKKTTTSKSKANGSAKKPVAKDSAKSKETAKSKVEKTNFNQPMVKEALPSNVTPLYPQSKETPLVMQPQIWIATAIAALALLFVIKKRK